MILGRLEKMDSAKEQNEIKIKKPQEVEKKDKIEDNIKHKNLESKKTKDIHEITISNYDFKFDKETGEFVIRKENLAGDVIQIPTEESLKQKKYSKELWDDVSNKLKGK